MSLPTSFFHTRTPLGGGGWLLQFDTTNRTFYIGNTLDGLRYVDALQAGYIGFDDQGTGGTRTANIIKFDKEGTVLQQQSYHRGAGLELRSFDVFDDGRIIYMGEDGGYTYIGTANADMTTNGTGHRFYNSVYGWTMHRNEGVTTGSTYSHRVSWVGRLATDQRMVMRPYGWDAGTNFSGIGTQLSSYHAGQVVNPKKCIVREDNGNICVVGKHPDWNGTPFINLYNPYFSYNIGKGIDHGSQASLFGEYYGVTWDYGQRQIASNTNNSVYAVGRQSQPDGQIFGTICNFGDYGPAGPRKVSTTTGWGTDGLYLRDVAYDDVANNRKIYIVGHNRSPLNVRNTAGGAGANSTDGVVLCVDISTYNAPTLDWAQGFYMTQSNGTQRNVDSRYIKVDDDGQLLVAGATTGYLNGRSDQSFIASLPTSGPINTVANGMTFYDASSLYQIQADTAGEFNTDHRGGSWSESNHAFQATNNNFGTGTLTEL
jgi:hypothetical protein